MFFPARDIKLIESFLRHAIIMFMLADNIYQDYVSALKAKDKHKADFLSFVRADLKNYAIEVKKEKLDDEEVIKVLKKHMKRVITPGEYA